MKLSVIIPVYCVEQTLNKCIESVLQQDVKDMEIILVDDGSPDNCPQFCDEWARKDSRITVIHKQNGGLSDARNAGIDIATGEYITFVDSDDYVEENTYLPIIEIMERHPQYDIVEYPIEERLVLKDRIYRDMNDYWLGCKGYLHTYAWNKIYKRMLFDRIRYPKDKVFEDVYTTPLILKSANTIFTTGMGCYHYSANPQGITSTADGAALAMLLEAHLQSGMPMDDEYYLHLANIQSDVWELTGQPIILPRRNLSYRSLRGKKKLKALILNILGLNSLCRINKIIHIFKKPSRW